MGRRTESGLLSTEKDTSLGRIGPIRQFEMRSDATITTQENTIRRHHYLFVGPLSRAYQTSAVTYHHTQHEPAYEKLTHFTIYINHLFEDVCYLPRKAVTFPFPSLSQLYLSLSSALPWVQASTPLSHHRQLSSKARCSAA